jgi:hypothetical protein
MKRTVALSVTVATHAAWTVLRGRFRAAGERAVQFFLRQFHLILLRLRRATSSNPERR